MDDLDARIDAANEKFFSSEGPADEDMVDLLQEERNAARQMELDRPVRSRGARPLMKVDFTVVSESALPIKYRKAKSNAEYYAGLGDTERASVIKNQYMQDYFLPTVDALVRMNTQEAVLSNKEVLDKMDSYALLDGSRGQGYTKSYVSTMYAPTGEIQRSDGEVKHTLHRIIALCEVDENRSAVGLARQLKNSIDRGDNMATPEDYEIIEKVALSE